MLREQSPGEAGQDGESTGICVNRHMQEVRVGVHVSMCTSGYMQVCKTGPVHVREAGSCNRTRIWGPSIRAEASGT